MKTTSKHRQLTIWSFIGFIFIVYGLIISGAGIYYWVHPPVEVALSRLQPSLWWGLFLLAVGIAFNWIDLRNGKSDVL